MGLFQSKAGGIKIPPMRVPSHIQALVPYIPGKPIDEVRRAFGIKHVIKLASNENPLGPSPRGLGAAKDALKLGHRYPDPSGYELKLALSSNLGVSPENIILGCGSDELIATIVRSTCVPGDAMVTHRAAFAAFQVCAQAHDVRTLEAPIGEDLKPDLDALAQIVENEPQARVVFLANPNNPTGAYLNTSELEAFVSRLLKIRGTDVLVVLDYAYWEYVTASDLPDPLTLFRKYPNVVILRTFSKLYGLAGFRVGYAISNPEVIATLMKVRQPFSVSMIGIAAAQAALGDHAFVKKTLKQAASGKKYWEDRLTRAGIVFWPSQGNFLLVDIGRGAGRNGSDFYHSCLRQGVIFRPVANYGFSNALRITIGTPAENRVALQVLLGRRSNDGASKTRAGRRH